MKRLRVNIPLSDRKRKHCRHKKTSVTNTYKIDHPQFRMRRRRKCLDCGKAFLTMEISMVEYETILKLIKAVG